MSVKVKTIVDWMEEWAPSDLAEPEDKIGLQIGSMQSEVTKIAVALDVTSAVVDEAIDQGAELIIAHHPILFRPLSALRTDRPDGRLIERLIKHNMAVFAAHTNLDVAVGGVNDLLADALTLQQTKPLRVTGSEVLCKLITYVPATHEAQVMSAMFNAGAGHIGKYSHCSFRMEGEGTFRPEQGAKPYLGAVGELERVKEIKLETIVPSSLKKAVIQALQKAHPYEEVAYDLIRLEQRGRAYGLGRMGTLPTPMTLSSFATHAKDVFGVPAVRYVGKSEQLIRKVAVLGGSGRSFVKDALACGADVLVTGDLDHHTAHDALAAGLALLDPGHHIEQIMKRSLAERLNARCNEEGLQIRAYASSLSTEPFTFC